MSNTIEQETELSEIVTEQNASNSQDSLSERVRRYVLATSKSLAEVHRVTGIGKSTLNPWLKGERTITTGIFDRICEAYKISPIRLYGLDSNNDVPTLQELSTFGEGEKPALMASLHEALELAKYTDQQTREKISADLQRMADATKKTSLSSGLLSRWFSASICSALPLLESEVKNMIMQAYTEVKKKEEPQDAGSEF